MLVILQEAAKVHRDEHALLRGMEGHDTCWWAFQTLRGPRRVQQNLLQAAVGTCASRADHSVISLMSWQKTTGKTGKPFLKQDFAHPMLLFLWWLSYSETPHRSSIAEAPFLGSPPPHPTLLGRPLAPQVWVPVLVSDSQVVSTWSPLPITVFFTLKTVITPPPPEVKRTAED